MSPLRQHGGDSLHEARRHVAHLLAPRGPVHAVADDLGHARVEQLGGLDGHGLEEAGRGVDGSAPAGAPLGREVGPGAEADVAHVGVGVAGELGGQRLVVAAQGAEDVPHGLEGRGLDDVVGVQPQGDYDGDDDVAVPLALEASHDASHRLHQRDGRLLGREEDDGVEGGHVDALGEAAHVADYVGLAPDGLAEDGEARLALVGGHGAGDVVGAYVGQPGEVSLGALVQLAPLLHGGPVFAGYGLKGRCRLVRHVGAGLGLARARHVVAEGYGRGQRAVAVGVVVEGVLLGGHAVDHALAHGGHGAEHPGRHVRDDVPQSLALVAAPHGPRLDALEQVVADHGLVDGQDEHLVVRQQPPLDGLAEGEGGYARAVDGLVVHREEGVALISGVLRLDVGIDLGRGGHVEPAPGADVVGVVDAREGALTAPLGLVGREVGGGGAVGLVAHGECELHAGQPLRLMHGVDALIGGEDHREAAPAAGAAERFGHGPRAGGGGYGEVEQALPHVVLVGVGGVCRARVGADADGCQRLAGGGEPAAERLADEGDAGRQEEDGPAAVATERLRQEEAGEGLARAAGHDEGAAVVRLIVTQGGGHNVGLVVPRLGGLALPEGPAVGQGLPVHGALRERAEVDDDDLGRLVGEGVGGVVAVALGGGHPYAPGEGEGRAGGGGGVVRLAAGGYEGVDGGLVDDGLLVVELALDGGEGAVAAAGHDVDAHVGGRHAVLGGEVGPEPGAVEEAGVDGVGQEPAADEPLEARALVALGGGGAAQGREDFVYGGWHWRGAFCHFCLAAPAPAGRTQRDGGG